MLSSAGLLKTTKRWNCKTYSDPQESDSDYACWRSENIVLFFKPFTYPEKNLWGHPWVVKANCNVSTILFYNFFQFQYIADYWRHRTGHNPLTHLIFFFFMVPSLLLSQGWLGTLNPPTHNLINSRNTGVF